MYLFETKYFRDVLRIAYETGSRLRKLGVLTWGTLCDDGRLPTSSAVIGKPKTVGAGQNSTYAQLNNEFG